MNLQRWRDQPSPQKILLAVVGFAGKFQQQKPPGSLYRFVILCILYTQYIRCIYIYIYLNIYIYIHTYFFVEVMGHIMHDIDSMFDIVLSCKRTVSCFGEDLQRSNTSYLDSCSDR